MTPGQQWTAKDIFAFPCVAATPKRSSYFTHFGESSLKNFARQARTGVPFNLMHIRQPRSYGYSFAGFFDGDSKDARAAIYIPRGRTFAPGFPTSNQVIDDIRTRMLREVSVGISEGDYICDVCGKYVFGMDCPHIPGMQLEDGSGYATCTIRNAHLIHIAGADSGACPGAVIGGAQQSTFEIEGSGMENYLAGLREKGNKADQPKRNEWADRLQLTSGRYFSTGGIHIVTPATGTEDRSMNFLTLLAAAFAAKGMTAAQAAVLSVNAEDPQAVTNAIMQQFEAHARAHVDSHPLLLKLKEYSIDSPDGLARLKASADEATSFREELLTDAKSEAERAFGSADKVPAGLIDALKNMSTDHIKTMRATWKAQADALVGITPGGTGSRQTSPMQIHNPAIFADQRTDDDDQVPEIIEKAAEKAAEMATARHGAK